jgi:uncharacterized membrane protein
MNQPAKLRPDGFRERGGEVTRIEAFVDAAFAFALTMLVISVGAIPDSMPKLMMALKGTPAFAASFALVATFWYAHMLWSRRYGLDDRGSILLSLLLVFLTMIFVYPLKVMFATFFGWISDGWLPMGFSLRSLSELRAMFVIYAVVYGTMILVISLLYLQAWRRRDALELSAAERIVTLEKIMSGVYSAGVAVVSFAIAVNLPERAPGWLMGLPGTIYALLGFSGMVSRAVARRVHIRLVAAGEA